MDQETTEESEPRETSAETEEAETEAEIPGEEISDITKLTEPETDETALSDALPTEDETSAFPVDQSDDETSAIPVETIATEDEAEEAKEEAAQVLEFVPEEEEDEEEDEEKETFQRKPSVLMMGEEEGEDYDIPENAFAAAGDSLWTEAEGAEFEAEEEEEQKKIVEKDEALISQAAPKIEPDVEEESSRHQVFICNDDETNRTLQMESYCCQQIKIPPMLPHVLKTFTKAAIKTQPRDLLRWAVAYFKALANDETPPVKERLEYPTLESPCGLTKGLLRILHKQLGKNEQVLENQLRDKWMGLCLDDSELTKLLHLNSFDNIIYWTHFVVIAAASIVNENLVEAMSVFCDTMTQQPDGVDPYVSYDIFAEAYTFLADKMSVDMRVAQNVCHFLRDLSRANFDLVGPKDFMAPECPPLF